MYTTIQESAEWIKAHTRFRPTIAVTLGSGLGPLADAIEDKEVIPYNRIPNFPVSTVAGHQGNLVLGRLSGKEVMAMQGRFHYYEGYDMKTVCFPVRVMQALGIETLFLTNAAGGVNPDFKVGDLMVIRDHINLFPENPLRGANDDRLGPRFPDMSRAYDPYLRRLAHETAYRIGLHLQEGVYLGWQGPSYETPAEYKLVRILGGDACGMSTVPEVIVANHAGLRVFALSVITNCALKEEAEKVTHEEVQQAARMAGLDMTSLIKEMIHQL